MIADRLRQMKNKDKLKIVIVAVGDYETIQKQS
jgi:hypothetical protein